MLGRGGMGVVWLAEDARLNEEVALKFLPSEISGDMVALDDMRRETQKAHRLIHANIVRIRDFFEAEDEQPFISMEYVDGRNLSEFRLREKNRVFSWDWLLPLVRQLCHALSYAHGEGVIHRDLKPGNLDVLGLTHLDVFDYYFAPIDKLVWLGRADLSNGEAALTTDSLPVGTSHVSARFEGSDSHQFSASGIELPVVKPK